MGLARSTHVTRPFEPGRGGKLPGAMTSTPAIRAAPYRPPRSWQGCELPIAPKRSAYRDQAVHRRLHAARRTSAPRTLLLYRRTWLKGTRRTLRRPHYRDLSQPLDLSRTRDEARRHSPEFAHDGLCAARDHRLLRRQTRSDRRDPRRFLRWAGLRTRAQQRRCVTSRATS